MAKRKRKGLGIFRIFIIVLIVAVIIFVLFIIFSGKKISLEKNNEIDTQEASKDNLNEEVNISCNKYDVYFDEDNKLGFNFIIAELTFVNHNGSLYYDLSNLTTSEKIKLDSVEYYLNKIKSFNYDVSTFKLLDTQFSSEGGSLVGNVFIPFTDSKNELSIYNGEQIKFDLHANKHNVNELFYEVETEDIKTDKYDIVVSNPYPETEFITADIGEPCSYPYVLIFELSVREITASNVYVENAKFIPEGALSGFSLDAIDDHVDSYKLKNVINKKLKTGDKYGLLFQASEQTPTSGTIMIKLSDSDKWIELKAGE